MRLIDFAVRQVSPEQIKAAGVATHPDPVVIDHQGDCAYRLGNKELAVTHWKQASERLDRMEVDREDLQELKLQLKKKLDQATRNAAVNVAPIVEPAGKQQSRNGN